MVNTQKFFSVDDHVLEHPKVWTDRMSRSRWGDRIPHLREAADGTAAWIIDGREVPLSRVADVGAVLGGPSERVSRWSEVPAAACDPATRLKSMNTGGIDCSVLYPMVAGVAGQTFGTIKDPELELACVQAYNDWLIEEWAAASPRFVPQCIVPLDPAAATKEIRRAVDKGHRGVVFPSIPLHLRDNVPHINDEAYDPVWGTCEELGVPLCFHSGASAELVMEPWSGFSPRVAEAYRAITRPASNSTIVGNMLMSRAIRSHPRLKVVFPESALGWIVFALEMGDHQFGNMDLKSRGYTHTLTELFQRQCYVAAWYDREALQHALRHVGAANILWSANFPQTTSPWPESRAFVAHSFEAVDAAAKERILWGNAASIYGVRH